MSAAVVEHEPPLTPSAAHPAAAGTLRSMDESQHNDDVYRRLGDLISWMFFPDRRPGLLGTAERIAGTADGGRPAELRRAGAGWAFVVEDEVAETFQSPAEALVAIPRHSFVYTTAIVTARIADLLFQGAVEQAEEGLRLYWQSLAMTIRANMEMAKGVVEPNFLQAILAVPLDDPIDFAIATGLLDRSLRRSVSAIGLAVSAAEAQVNDWVEELGGWREREDLETLVRKMKIVAAKAGSDLDIGRSPFQEMQSLVDFRHDITHPKPIPQDVRLGGTEAPGHGPSVQARKTCSFVRRCLIEVAGAIGRAPPRYLAYCPPGRYDDDDAWRAAVIMTGARDDPDFPPIGSAGPDASQS